MEAAKFLGENNSISVLLAGSGPSLQEAAAHAASCHPSISKVLSDLRFRFSLVAFVSYSLYCFVCCGEVDTEKWV